MRQEFFVFQTKFSKIPIKLDNAKLVPTKANPDAILKISRIDLIYEVTVQIYPSKLFKGLKTAKHLIENSSYYFDRPIKIQIHILINRSPTKNELSLANLNFKQIQFRNREVILRDHLNSFLQNALEIFSFAERNKNSLRRIILLPS